MHYHVIRVLLISASGNEMLSDKDQVITWSTIEQNEIAIHYIRRFISKIRDSFLESESSAVNVTLIYMD